MISYRLLTTVITLGSGAEGGIGYHCRRLSKPSTLNLNRACIGNAIGVQSKKSHFSTGKVIDVGAVVQGYVLACRS